MIYLQLIIIVIPCHFAFKAYALNVRIPILLQFLKKSFEKSFFIVNSFSAFGKYIMKIVLVLLIVSYNVTVLMITKLDL